MLINVRYWSLLVVVVGYARARWERDKPLSFFLKIDVKSLWLSSVTAKTASLLLPFVLSFVHVIMNCTIRTCTNAHSHTRIGSKRMDGERVEGDAQ